MAQTDANAPRTGKLARSAITGLAAARIGMAELMQLWKDGKIKPRVTGTYSLADGGKAIAKLGDRSAVGKLVVTV